MSIERSGESNVVRLFFTEEDLEEAWQRFDRAALRLHALYGDPESSELDRRVAAKEAAEAEIEFRKVYARAEAPKLLSA
jgi:hypothetical protein